MRVIFSEKIAQALPQHLEWVYQAAQTLKTLRLDDLAFGYGQQRQGIKRLFFSDRRLIPLWRYRCGDYRVVFWAGLQDYQETAILWLAGHRRDIYHTLSHKLPGMRQTLQEMLEHSGDPVALERWEEHLTPPGEELPWQDLAQESCCFHWPKHLESEVALITHIQSGLFRLQPVLNRHQHNLFRQVEGVQWRPFSPLLAPIQGGAGTGKTTLGVALVAHFCRPDSHLYPILVVPNRTLAAKAEAVLRSEHPNYRLALHWRDLSSAQGLVTTRDQLLQALAGDTDPSLPLGECNRRLREQLHAVPGFSRWQHSNLYGLLRGFSPDPNMAYPSNQRDPLTQQYESINQLLQKAWRPSYEAVFADRDPYAQARRALAQVSHRALPPTATHRYLLILDEIQDYYWFQLLPLLRLSQTINSQPLLVLLGDDNQRVTLSGFTWAALATIVHHQLGLILPQPLELSENFRNTMEIARVARYTLLQGFKHLLHYVGGRHLRDPGLPGTARHGAKPRLQVIEDDQAFWEHLPALMAPEDPNELPPNYIFILAPDSNWKDTLRLADPDEHSLIAYTIAEAKGQEFDAVIWVHPFATCGEQLEPDQLFQWYTTITRARTYQVWLLSPGEYEWLNRQANQSSEPLPRLFTDHTLPLGEFIRELRQEARTQLTVEQKRLRSVLQFSDDFQEWLFGGPLPVPPPNLPALQWQPWEFLDALLHSAQEHEWLQEFSVQHLTLPIEDPWHTILLYWICRIVSESAGVALPEAWHAQARQSLFTYLTAHPDQQALALGVGDPEWQSFVYWALGSSWQAALHCNQHWRESHFQKNQAIIRAISQHLEQQGLSLEALRLRVSLGLEPPPSDLLTIPSLWDPPTPTPTTPARLCHHLVETLSDLLPTSAERASP